LIPRVRSLVGIGPRLLSGLDPEGPTRLARGASSVTSSPAILIMDSSSGEQPGEGPTRRRPPEQASYGNILLVWIALMLALNGIRWLGGFPAGGVAEGVEEGVARAELQVRGESTEEQIRKAIRSQRETIPFWTALSAIDDFLIEPAMLAGRAVAVAMLFAGVAAVTGRPIQYERALRESARIQGLWVLGLAFRVAMLVCLRRSEAGVETSLGLLLGPGAHSAMIWLVLRQLDIFALIGWAALAWSGWKRGDAAPATAAGLCGGLCLAEVSLRAAVGLLIGGSMRLSLMLD
jgi:hypothetical protein